MTQSQPEYSYKPGTIRSLKLVNFMCHDSFELNLGPRVNFVIGPNGSGKSALLTALVVVLGGRATTTSRAKRQNEFVMYGKKSARITCVIHNYDKIMEKDQAFKPDDYGKRIIVEKTIYCDDPARLVLKNDKGKKVSERKQELDEMLEHFGILINNPICILNQEISKSFLHSKRPEDKFDLFMKATNLEQIENDYLEAEHSYRAWGQCNDRKAVGFRILESDYAACKEKISFLIDRARLQDQHRDLQCELVWAIIRDQEDKAAQVEQRIVEYGKEIDQYRGDTERRNEFIEKAQIRIELHDEKKKACDEDCEKSQKKLTDNRKKSTNLRMKKHEIEGEINSYKSRLKHRELDKTSVEKKIAEIRQKMDIGNSAEENERRKLEIEQLKQEIESEEARYKTLDLHTNQVMLSHSDSSDQLSRANRRLSELRYELSSKESQSRRLKSGQRDVLNKYGEHMTRILEEIRKSADRFRCKPLGPLGYHISLKTPEIADALEVHLGRNCFAFTCDNIQDVQLLNRIIRELKRQSKGRWPDPLVLCRKFKSRHDTNSLRAQHDRYKPLIDHIEVKEDAVYNILVDRTGLDTVLFVPDFKEAENLMITPPLVPKNARCAYTQDCHVMYPRTARGGYRCIANNRRNQGLFTRDNSEQIRQTEREIADLRADINDAEINMKKLEESKRMQIEEFKNNKAELKKIATETAEKKNKLFSLENTLAPPQPEELTAMEEELEDCLKKIADAKRAIEVKLAELNSINSECQEVEGEYKSLEAIAKKRNSLRRQVVDQIESEQHDIRQHEAKKKENILHIKRLEAKIDEDTKALNDLQNEIVNSKRDITEEENPSVIRATSEISVELKTVNRLLSTQIAENADPEVVLAGLRKRMAYIENLKELKEHNKHNYDLTTKMLKDREDGFHSLRSQTCCSVSTTFSSVMRAMEMNGMLKIHLKDHIVDGEVVSKAKTLEMSVDTTSGSQRPGGLTQSGANTSNASKDNSVNGRRSTRSQPPDVGPRTKRARMDVSPSEKENRIKMTDTRSLSGGERSFSTVAFVLALWHHCASPFKLMDEIDVFMDMVTRRTSYQALIKFSQVTDNSGQFIFFSPLELPRIEDTENLVRVFEMPKIIRKGSQPNVSSTAGGDE